MYTKYPTCKTIGLMIAQPIEPVAQYVEIDARLDVVSIPTRTCRTFIIFSKHLGTDNSREAPPTQYSILSTPNQHPIILGMAQVQCRVAAATCNFQFKVV